ncbi:hypothetical protein SNEBB_006353 [Seison nebaliae]|nr:hypothetical protein SNEBB_006353 [Seison nebaliae]
MMTHNTDINTSTTNLGENFYEIGHYKKTVKRAEDGYKLCGDLIQMMNDRAEIEKSYAKSLKAWTRKWNDYNDRSCGEIGTMLENWKSISNEGDKLADSHLNIRQQLIDKPIAMIRQWQRETYSKTIMNNIKQAEEFKEGFKKAQKPWQKCYDKVEKAKKDYHNSCRFRRSAEVTLANAAADTAMSNDQKRKLEEKLDKAKKDVEVTEHTYHQKLYDIGQINEKYQREMNEVFEKCQDFESQRLKYFKLVFEETRQCLDIRQSENINQIYTDLFATIRRTNVENDLSLFSRIHGPDMPMRWPEFEEYTEEIRPISTKRFNRNTLKGDALGSTDSHSSQINGGVANNSNVVLTNIVRKDEENAGADNPFDEDGGDATSNIEHSQNQHLYPMMGNSTSSCGSSDGGAGTSSNMMVIGGDESVRVRALYPYTGQESDELSFDVGEEFVQLEPQDEQGWCKGKIGERVGLYPATYVNRVQ